MTLIVCGLNHQSAPLSVREHVAARTQLPVSAILGLPNTPYIHEFMVLSTCNRSEWIGVVKGEVAQAREAFSQWIVEHYQLDASSWQQHCYQYTEQTAVQHMLRVASGLDSMVLGEPQILGQLKDAYQKAKQARWLGPQLECVLQSVFAATKSVRTELGLGEHAVSVAAVSVNLAQRIFCDLTQKKVLLVGAGETIELVAQHLHQHGVRHICVANRNVDNAKQIAEQYAGRAISLPQLPAHLHEADIVISATGRSLPIIGKGMVEQALQLRQQRPMCMLDLAVPRDIEPEVRQLQDVYLYDLDDLQAVIAESQKHRQRAAHQAEHLLTKHSEHILKTLHARSATPAISAYRQYHTRVRDELVAQALTELQRGAPSEEVLTTLGHRLTNTFMHEPTLRLREAGFAGDATLLDNIEQLFLSAHAPCAEDTLEILLNPLTEPHS